jgi:hypothetical protein
MAKRTPRNPMIRKMKALEANYHPDSVKFIIEKHGYDATPEQAEVADQEWAAKRLQEFGKGQGRVNSEMAEHIMQEPPLGAAIPAKRSEEFDNAKANTGNQGMAVSESAGETEQRFVRKPMPQRDVNLGSI